MADELYHYGMKRRSGRYPYGSGERPYQDKEILRAYKKNEMFKLQKRKEKLEKRNPILLDSYHARNLNIVSKEMDVVKNMTIDQLTEEKNRIANNRIKTALMTCGSIALSTIAPIPGFVFFPSSKGVKTKYRIQEYNKKRAGN